MRACLQSLGQQLHCSWRLLAIEQHHIDVLFFRFREQNLCPIMAAVHSEMNHGKKSVKVLLPR